MHRKSLCADDLRIKTIEKFSPLVYRLAFSQLKTKSDADDIHQEVFVRYITKKPKFESEEHAKDLFHRNTPSKNIQVCELVTNILSQICTDCNKKTTPAIFIAPPMHRSCCFWQRNGKALAFLR